MKQFTVVFPVAEAGGKQYILLGRQKPGKPLAEFINGYGGKVEESDQSILAAAERELQEELLIPLDSPAFIGTIVHQTKEIFFYLSKADKVEYADTEETRENKWYDLADIDMFTSRMLPGDLEIIEHIQQNIHPYFGGETVSEFKILKEGVEIDNAVAELNKSILK
jgi:8-oxo-dGTP pyrophosphatase MutT (NUDIX family)